MFSSLISRTSISFWASLIPENAFMDKHKASPVDQLLKSRFLVEDLTANDQALLLNAVIESDTTAIAQCVTKIKPLKLAVENRILFEMENSAASNCIRSKSSYLYPKDYHSLRDFSFNDLYLELIEKQPFLLKCLLAIAIPTTKVIANDITQNLDDLIPRLSFIYGSLMSVRFKELSRLQRTVSVVLMEENVHEKVCRLLVFIPSKLDNIKGIQRH